MQREFPSGTDDGAPAMEAPAGPRLIYRQSGWTRLTHCVWSVCLFFLLLSGLQIFNSHPALYIGTQSGFEFDNSVLVIGAERTPEGPEGYTTILGRRFETTGILGLSTRDGQLEGRAFPGWATIPSHHDLATGRVVHFFFAWMLVSSLLVWLVASILNRHLWRDIVPGRTDAGNFGRDLRDHLRFRFHHDREYNVLQKLSYGLVLLVLLPLMILTGLTMSPGLNAAYPWMLDLFGGRQTARTIHFFVMVLLVLFFFVHIGMIIASGPFNAMRSIVTGWYRTGSRSFAIRK